MPALSDNKEIKFRCIYRGDAGAQQVDHKVSVMPPSNNTQTCPTEIENGRFWPETPAGIVVYVTCPPNTVGKLNFLLIKQKFEAAVVSYVSKSVVAGLFTDTITDDISCMD